MADWHDAEWAHGSTLHAWLYPRLGFDREEPLARRVEDWRKRRQISFAEVDRVLCALGMHVSEAPDAAWGEGPLTCGSRARVDWAARRVALDAYRQVGTVKGAARIAGVSPKTVRRWLGVAA